jgi:hypothetical protein
LATYTGVWMNSSTCSRIRLNMKVRSYLHRPALYVGRVISRYRKFGWLVPTGALDPLAKRRAREWNLTWGLWQFLSAVQIQEIRWTGSIHTRQDRTVGNTACCSEYWLDAQHAWEKGKHSKHFCTVFNRRGRQNEDRNIRLNWMQRLELLTSMCLEYGLLDCDGM